MVNLMGWSLLGWFEAGIIAGCRAKKAPGWLVARGFIWCWRLCLSVFSLREKPAGICVLRFQRKATTLLVITKGAKQMQQAREQVIDVQVQAHCRHDVVGLAAVDDAAGVKQDKA